MLKTALQVLAVLFFASCNNTPEKKNNIDRWIQEADSITAQRNRIQFVADSVFKADSSAAAQARYADSLYYTEHGFTVPHVENRDY